MNRLTALWRFVRKLAGDDAYERYLAHHSRERPKETPLDRKAFYLERQQRKWGGVQRCC